MAKTPDQKIAELQAAKARINNRLKDEKRRQRNKARKAERRGNYIVGAVVMKHAEHDPEFRELLWRVLDQQTTRSTDREFLGLPVQSTSGKTS